MYRIKRMIKKAKILSLMIAILGLSVSVTSAQADEANQTIEIEKSGVIVLKGQRQGKTPNSNQTIKINKSGGIFIIIQRNINKYKGDDLKNILDKTETSKQKK